MSFLKKLSARISYALIKYAHTTRYFILCVFGKREQMRGVRIILTQDGKVVLVKHWYAPGAWTLPGGGVHLGEDAEEAARREAYEETGYVVRSFDHLLGEYSGRMGPSDIVRVYATHDYEDSLTFAPSFEIMKRGMFDVNNLPENLTPANRRRIEAFKRGVRNETGKW